MKNIKTFEELVENILKDEEILNATNRYLFLDASLEQITEIILNKGYKKTDERYPQKGFYHEDDTNCIVGIDDSIEKEKNDVSKFGINLKLKLNLLYSSIKDYKGPPKNDYLEKIKPIFEGIIKEQIPALFLIDYPLIDEILEPYAINKPKLS